MAPILTSTGTSGGRFGWVAARWAATDVDRMAATAAVELSGAATANATGNAGHEHPKRRPRGQPLPAFSGLSLENEKISAADLLGKRMLIYFFNPEVRRDPLLNPRHPNKRSRIALKYTFSA